MNFVAPLFLAGLAALALPWLLHRFSHQDPEQQPFPSTRFLDAVPPPVSRRRQLRHKILLALRWLLLALLCLAFARPWLDSLADAGDGRALHLLVIDRSLSMQASSRFDTALDEARDILSSLPAGDPVRVFAADDRFIELTEDDATAATARGELSGLDAGDGRLDIGAVMRRLDTLATEARLPAKAYFVTDMQKSALPVRRNELFAPSLNSLDVVAVAEDAPVNARLSAIASTPDEALMRVVVTAEVSGSDEPVSREFVIEHDGRELARDTLLLEPGVSTERVFDNLAMPATASPVLDVRFVEADAIAVDDSVRLAVSRDAMRRVAIAGFGVRVPDTSEVFVRTALESGADASVENLAAVGTALPEDARHAVIFARIGDADAMANIKRQTDRGVNVLVVPVPSATSPAVEEVALVARVDGVHPIALGELSWGAVRFYEQAAFAVEQGDEVLIASANAHPVLMERPSTGGRLLVLNDPLDGQASNLPFEPVFVDMIERIVDWFDAADAVPDRVHVGDTLVLPARAQVFTPDGSPMAGLGDAGSATSLNLRERGVHRVLDSRGERFVHVLVDPRESVLNLMDDETSSAWRARHEQDQGADAQVESGAELPASSARREPPQDRPLWHLMLLGVVLLIAAESILGNRRLAVRRDGS